MKEYTGGGVTKQEQYFGLMLCEARMVIECAFGRLHLKARFGILKIQMDINLDDLSTVRYACFVLHNFCELHGENMTEEHVRSAINYDNMFQPGTQTAPEVNNVEGKRIQRMLTRYFDPQMQNKKNACTLRSSILSVLYSLAVCVFLPLPFS